jgi:uncharacterized protein (UPF0210 family)
LGFPDWNADLLCRSGNFSVKLLLIIYVGSERMRRTLFRLERHAAAVKFAVAAIFLLAVVVQILAQSRSPIAQPKAKIRTITAFVNVDRSQYQQQVADAVKMLKYSRTLYESRGFEVQSIRLTTQPFSEYTKGLTLDQAVAFFKELDALAVKENLEISIGAAMPNAKDNYSQSDLVGEVLRSTRALNTSLVVAGDDGVRRAAVDAAARVMKKLAETTEHSEGNLRFAATALVPSLTPFFPASYHTGFGHQFTIGLEAGTLLAAAVQGTNRASAKQRFAEMLGRDALDIETHADRIDRETGWAYKGIDLSVAPSKGFSVVASLEALSGQPFKSARAMETPAIIIDAIKSVTVTRAGYNGLMLPPLEDPRLAKQWDDGSVSLDTMMRYCAVGTTGLDEIPLAGDTTSAQLASIIAEVANLAVKAHRPLSVRLLPVAGKAPGEMTEFTNPNLINVTLQPPSQAERSR